MSKVLYYSTIIFSFLFLTAFVQSQSFDLVEKRKQAEVTIHHLEQDIEAKLIAADGYIQSLEKESNQKNNQKLDYFKSAKKYFKDTLRYIKTNLKNQVNQATTLEHYKSITSLARSIELEASSQFSIFFNEAL